MKPTDYFLDNITGDLYNYNYENEEWVAKANAGIHFQKAAQTFHSIGKFIIQAPLYRPKTVTDNNRNIYVSRNTEVIGYLKKLYLHHWAVQGMSMEYLVPFKNSWYVHSFAFTNKSKKFDILAECEKGPLIVEFKNILATQFEIDPKYPETSIPLKNFIHFHLRLIKTFNKSSESLILTYYNAARQADEIQLQLGESSKNRKFNRTFKLFEGEEKSNKFTHAGLAMKRHGESFIVDQNAVADKAFKMKTKPERTQTDQKESKWYQFQGNVNTEKSPEKKLKTQKTRPFSQYGIKFNDDTKENENLVRILQGLDGYRPSTLNIQTQDGNRKKAEIREILHPNLAKEFLTQEDLWVR